MSSPWLCLGLIIKGITTHLICQGSEFPQTQLFRYQPVLQSSLAIPGFALKMNIHEFNVFGQELKKTKLKLAKTKIQYFLFYCIIHKQCVNIVKCISVPVKVTKSLDVQKDFHVFQICYTKPFFLRNGMKPLPKKTAYLDALIKEEAKGECQGSLLLLNVRSMFQCFIQKAIQ